MHDECIRPDLEILDDFANSRPSNPRSGGEMHMHNCHNCLILKSYLRFPYFLG